GANGYDLAGRVLSRSGPAVAVSDPGMAKGGFMAGSPAGDQDPAVRIRQLETMLGAITGYAFIQLDADGRIVSWDSSAEALRGYSEQDVLGQPVGMLYTAEDRAAGVPERELAD